MDVATESATAFGRGMIDELLERYISWREECQAVRLAYQSWAQSGRWERRLTYAGYLAALDREEQAARIYAGHVDSAQRCLQADAFENTSAAAS